jgi:hypothetical protein
MGQRRICHRDTESTESRPSDSVCYATDAIGQDGYVEIDDEPDFVFRNSQVRDHLFDERRDDSFGRLKINDYLFFNKEIEESFADDFAAIHKEHLHLTPEMDSAIISISIAR